MFGRRFEVCGMIEMTPLTVHSRNVRVRDASGELASTAAALADGTFCVHCKPGVYQFSVGSLVVLHIDRKTRNRCYTIDTTAKQVAMVWACAAKRRH